MPWIKEEVPDVPACRHLGTIPESKEINGQIFRVQRPNPLCMKMIGEPVCGYCRYSISEDEVYVGELWNHLLQLGEKKKKWSTVVDESLLVPAESIARTKAFSINMCKKTKACGQEIDRLRIKFDALDSVGKKLKNK